jgi:hypothetical protein
MATDEPAAPLTGERLVISGGAKKLLVVVTLPIGVATVMGPVVTFTGVLAAI